MAQEQIKLETKSNQGTFTVEIMWMPNDIGRANTFEIHFIDPDTGIEIEDVKYDISIYNEDGRRNIQRNDQVSTQQKFSFEKAGSYVVRIDNIEDLGENATIPIQVTPEFPAIGVLMLAATIIGGIVLLARRNSNSLFSLQPN